ncbi:MAG: Na/Pi cotransporter family protein [Prevotella sp.]|uniref:Na/Pi cotransporter family protein n=1 Tax=Prevotella sp. TaxID=59823 RepID=UPI002A34685D|nr:Na/Pi cotransporter family protein [Prevotella sp.]MDD7318868.1 Na/Pi cotransporter family protein [Prevotellaceae bacterium]MDY4019246.1 Na/Pi cotransporter family protein [Prevotella sp.]
MTTVIAFKLLGSLALLIFGMKIMSEALQKMAGSQLRHVLSAMTTNRLSGMFTGMLLTVAVQSSSATTVMTVSFVNAGLLALSQAISVIMGANIGTTLTAWIMSAGFSFDITNFVWPVFFIGILLIYSKRHRYLGDFLYGVAFMFFSLGMMSQTGKAMDLGHNQTLIDFFSSFDTGSYSSILIFLLIGTVLTCIVQSSAAVMAITMVLCTSGVLPVYLGIALVMGENIGTTMTANLAALTANTQARRAALAHLTFNVIGVIWVLMVFYPFVNIVCSFVGLDPSSSSQTVAKVSFALAAFHTAFNITNTSILIWFIPQIERFVCWMLPEKPKKEDESFRLRYIQVGIIKTPEISVLEAQKETMLFAERMYMMFGMVQELTKEKDKEKFKTIFERIKKYEDISDNMEIEIGKYLEHVSDAHLSDDTKGKIRDMMREISELESIGDACYNLARILQRKNESVDEFTLEQNVAIEKMMQLTDHAIKQMLETIGGRREEVSIAPTRAIEKSINNLRDELKLQNTTDVNSHKYGFATGAMFIDVISECEKLGDYVMNVVEARLGKNAD